MSRRDRFISYVFLLMGVANGAAFVASGSCVSLEMTAIALAWAVWHPELDRFCSQYALRLGMFYLKAGGPFLEQAARLTLSLAGRCRP